MILKYYLKRFHKIDIDLEYGVVEHQGSFSFHIWNSYSGKKLDVTIHNQLIPDLSSDCYILDEIYIKKDGDIIFHPHDRLPDEYLAFIAEVDLTERALQAKENRSETEEDDDTLGYWCTHRPYSVTWA